MATDNKYNGWANYATWRINLEWFDSDEILLDLSKDCTDIADFSKALQNYVESFLDEQPQTLFRDYAESFLSYVNWYEIAEHYTELLFNADEQ